MRGAAGRAETAGLDDLPGDRKAAILAEPAQALHDRLVLDFRGGAAIIANHELAFMRMLDIVACHKGTDAFDFVDQLVCKQKIKCAVNRRRSKLAAASPCNSASNAVGAERLIGGENEFEDAPSHRGQSRPTHGAELLGTFQRAFDVLRFHDSRFHASLGDRRHVNVTVWPRGKQQRASMDNIAASS